MSRTDKFQYEARMQEDRRSIGTNIIDYRMGSLVESRNRELPKDNKYHMVRDSLR